MWCPKCQIDKTVDQTETAASPVCDVCHSVLSSQPPENKPAQTSNAHKLLERWSDQRMLTPSGELPKANALAPLEGQNLPEISEADLKKRNTKPRAVAQAPKRQPKPANKPKPNTVKLSEHLKSKTEKPVAQIEKPARKTISISDRPERKKQTPQAAPTRAAQTSKTSTKTNSKAIQSNRPLPSRKKAGASRPRRKPEYDVQAAIREQIMKQKSWLSAIGYLFSYGGALLLTAGAGLTLWSFFGKSVDNVPTEWLVTTIGQLFLFAGLVMLVTVVVDQVGKKILFRISQLDDRLVNIEEHLSRLESEETETAAKPERRSVPLRKAG